MKIKRTNCLLFLSQFPFIESVQWPKDTAATRLPVSCRVGRAPPADPADPLQPARATCCNLIKGAQRVVTLWSASAVRGLFFYRRSASVKHWHKGASQCGYFPLLGKVQCYIEWAMPCLRNNGSPYSGCCVFIFVQGCKFQIKASVFFFFSHKRVTLLMSYEVVLFLYKLTSDLLTRCTTYCCCKHKMHWFSRLNELRLCKCSAVR